MKLTNKPKFINTLYDFLDVNNLEKKNYVLSNIDKLFQLCLNGKDRFWKGNNSHGNIDFYYKKIGAEFKERIDGYINDKIKKYPFLSEKYDINKM